jgi:hypothetical protein
MNPVPPCERGPAEIPLVGWNIPDRMEDNPHRFLNVMVRGTYIAPHRRR